MEGEEQRRQDVPLEPGRRRPMHALTHILTHPTATPSLHSQLVVSAHFPSRLPLHNSDYPPIAPSLRWSLSLFLRRCLPRTSWRSKCPFQFPPPPVLSSGVEPVPESWGAKDRMERFKRRFRRRKLGVEVPLFVGLTIPNLVLFGLLLWNPLLLRWLD